jgi:hypothetical protein
MARQAVVSDEDPRAALLEAKLKAWFALLASEPVPARLLRHVERLDGKPVNGFHAARPETR